MRPTYQMIHHVLTNPAYAGLFVYGRRVQQAQPGDPPHLRSHRRPLEEWDIVVPDVYPPYVSEAQYRANREMLQANQYNFVKKAAWCAARRARAPGRAGGLRTLWTTDDGELRRRASRLPVPA